jgi:hypothetical protein
LYVRKTVNKFVTYSTFSRVFIIFHKGCDVDFDEEGQGEEREGEGEVEKMENGNKGVSDEMHSLSPPLCVLCDPTENENLWRKCHSS